MKLVVAIVGFIAEILRTLPWIITTSIASLFEVVYKIARFFHKDPEDRVEIEQAREAIRKEMEFALAKKRKAIAVKKEK